MKTKQETFASIIRQFGPDHDLSTVFDDFLTIAICALGIDRNTGAVPDRDLFEETIGKYENKTLQRLFTALLKALMQEMEEQYEHPDGNDVLGTFYETHIAGKQCFTRWAECAIDTKKSAERDTQEKPRVRRILDPCCNSGRRLVTESRLIGINHKYYGIDNNHTYVRMAVLTMYFNGLFDSEIMWANVLEPDDFRMSYVISFVPLGIFRIKDKANSKLWQIMQDTPVLRIECREME